MYLTVCLLICLFLNGYNCQIAFIFLVQDVLYFLCCFIYSCDDVSKFTEMYKHVSLSTWYWTFIMSVKLFKIMNFTEL
jgi:hypothetical protein